MFFLQYTISPDDENRRIDRVLRKFLKDDLTLSQIYKSLRNGQIKVNNKKIKQDYKTKKDDIIFIDEYLIKNKNEIKTDNSTENFKKNYKLEVIFENQYIKIINKPYNIAVQKSQKDEIALDDIIKSQYNPTEKSLSFKPGPLHRLDKKTTGLLTFSNNLVGAQKFSEILQNHQITKTYVAVLEGKLTTPQKWIDNISANKKSQQQNFKTVSITKNQDKSAKEAITEVFPIKSGFFNNKEITLAKINIYTGRTHQIRSQCAYHNFPLLGDTAYNKNTKKISKDVDFFLHSYKISLSPENPLQIPTEIIAPLPKNFVIFLKNYLSIEDFAL